MTTPSIGEKAMLGYEELLTETCSYEHYSKVNKYNEKDYESPVPVKCFTSFDFSNVLGAYEQDITLTKIVFISNEFEPNPYDKIDGLEIKSIKPVKGLLVPTIGWQIVL